MPRGDRTGPMGFGAMTGRGWRNWFWATGLTGWQRQAMFLPAFGGWGDPYWFPFGEITPEQEADILRSQAELLKSEMEDIQSRIEALKKLRA